MKISDLGRYALGICAAVAVLSGCGGSQPPSMSLAPQIAAPQSAAVGSSRCLSRLFVDPRSSYRRVGRSVNLHAILRTHAIGRGCWRGGVQAAWSASGGSLQVINGGWEAIFSASLPGTYTVFATYGGLTGSAEVTVTSP